LAPVEMGSTNTIADSCKAICKQRDKVIDERIGDESKRVSVR